jgi:CubicO group peptidase (beta-lactamase class C family)
LIKDTLTPDHDTINAFTPHGLRYLPQPGAYYRNQWWVINARTNTTGGSYAALGIHGQMILIDEPSNTVITKLSTWPDSWDDHHAQTSIQGSLDLARRLG